MLKFPFNFAPQQQFRPFDFQNSQKVRTQVLDVVGLFYDSGEPPVQQRGPYLPSTQQTHQCPDNLIIKQKGETVIEARNWKEAREVPTNHPRRSSTVVRNKKGHDDDGWRKGVEVATMTSFCTLKVGRMMTGDVDETSFQ